MTQGSVRRELIDGLRISWMWRDAGRTSAAETGRFGAIPFDRDYSHHCAPHDTLRCAYTETLGSHDCRTQVRVFTSGTDLEGYIYEQMSGNEISNPRPRSGMQLTHAAVFVLTALPMFASATPSIPRQYHLIYLVCCQQYVNVSRVSPRHPKW